MRGEDTTAAHLGELHAAQVRRWSSRSLAGLCEPATGALALDVAFVRAWQADATAAAAWAGGVDVEVWARALVRWLHSRQQFLIVDGDRVRAAVERGLAVAIAEGPASGLVVVREEVVAQVRAQVKGRIVDVVCGEYSPALQLRVLGLDVETIAGPVLDVGCGEKRALVEELRARGVEAEGIDRVHGDDWFDYMYGVGRWGAVISHHGFSLHFMHHHFRPGPLAMAYARTYMDILRSVRPGGVFAYAIGLPFIEAMLPAAEYRVVRIPLPTEVGGSAVQALRDRVGMAVDHATQVWRR